MISLFDSSPKRSIATPSAKGLGFAFNHFFKADKQEKNKVAELGKKALLNSTEDRIVFAGQVVQLIDFTKLLVFSGIEGPALIIDFFKLDPTSAIFPIARAVALPFTAVSMVFSSVLLGFEALSLRRAVRFFSLMSSSQKTTLEKIDYLQERYFTITQKDIDEINAFMDAHQSEFSTTEEEQKCFDELINFYLDTKLNCLKRRVAVNLGEETGKQIALVKRGLNSKDPTVKYEAELRAELLVSSLVKGSRWKMVSRILKIASLALAIIGGIAVLAGGGFPILIALAVAPIVLLIIQFAVNKFGSEAEKDRLLQQLQAFKLVEEEMTDEDLELVEAL